MKRKAIVTISALAAGMILTASIGGAWGYFTTNTSAQGGYAIELGNETQIVETYSDHTKHLVVSNDGDQPVYVRAKAFSGTQCQLEYSGDPEGSWREGNGGYWYYSVPLPGAATADDGTVTPAKTSPLDVTITFPADAKEGDECDVVVIYESIPVQYDVSGELIDPMKADWSVELITPDIPGKTEGGNES